MTKLTSVLTMTVVSGGALLAFGSPAQAQLPCYNCVDNPRIEQEETSSAPAGIAALGGLTAAGLAGLALRRRRAA